MLNKPPFFSIVTIVRNDLNGLQKTFESVINQTYTNIEWIVIDGASDDGCVKYLQSLEIKNFHWISEPDKGIYDAMNKGIELAQGEYINFLNAGDYFQKNNILELVNEKIENNSSQVDLIFGGAFLQMKNGHNYYRKPKSLKHVPYGLPSIHQSTYYLTKLIKETNYDVNFKICGDYYLICKLSLHQPKALIIDMPLVAFTVGGVSYTKPLNLIRESFYIKKNILNLNVFLRIFVFLRMLISFSGIYLINNTYNRSKK